MLQRLVAGVAIAAVAALALVGCTPEEPTETTPAAVTPTPASTPAATGDDEVTRSAFATAQEFYALVDQSFESGSLDRDGLSNVATEAAIAKVQGELDQFIAMGWRVQGHSTLDTPALIDATQASSFPGVVELLVCLDTSDVVASNADGVSVGGSEPRQVRAFSLEYDGERMRVEDFGPPRDQSTELSGCGSSD